MRQLLLLTKIVALFWALTACGQQGPLVHATVPTAEPSTPPVEQQEEGGGVVIGEGFERRDNTLLCENISLETLATTYGTPLYVYSRRAIESAFCGTKTPLSDRRHLICYAVKARF